MSQVISIFFPEAVKNRDFTYYKNQVQVCAKIGIKIKNRRNVDS